MLTQFRSFAHSFFAKLLLILLVLSFAVWGVEDMVRSGGGEKAVAKIGKTSISIESYQRAVQREAENIRQMLGENYSPELVKMLQPEKRAMQSLIQKNLLDRESKALGIIPSDEEIVRRIRKNPAFQDTRGSFDKERFLAILKNSRISEKQYVESLRQEMGSALLMHAVSKEVPLPDIAVQTLYNAQEEQLKVTLYTLGASQVKLSTPSNEMLEQYYTLHAGEYNAPEYRTVSYVILKPEEAKTTAKISDDDIKAAYSEREDEFRRPERREVDQLLFNKKEDAEKAYADLTSGKNFDAVAKSSPIQNKGAISLGKVERERVLEAAADAVFSAPKGGVTAPVESLFGWHVFHVRSVEPASVAPLSEVRAILEKDLKERSVEEAQNNFLNRFEDALAGGASLQETAKEFGLKVEIVGPMAQDGKSPEGKIVKLPDLDKFMEVAFKTSEKTESSLINAKGGAYYVLRVDSVSPEHPRPLSEVRAEVLASWQKDERTTHLKEMADTAAKAMAEKKPHGLSASYAGTIKRSSDKAGTIALTPALMDDAFSRKPGEATAAYHLPSGEFAIAVAGERIPAKAMSKEASETLRAQLRQGAQDELALEYMKHLEQKYPVWINEPLLQSLQSQASN